MNNIKAPKDIVIVYTSEPKSALLKNCGSGDWTANISQLSSVKYLLCIHNDKMKGFFEHDDIIDKNDLKSGQAFYIGKVNKIIEIEVDGGKKRKFIQVSEYAFLPEKTSYEDAWKMLTGNKENSATYRDKGQQNPVAYKNKDYVFETLKIQEDEIKWEKVENLSESDEEKKSSFSSLSLADLIQDARVKIAKVAGVNVNKVNIEIDFK